MTSTRLIKQFRVDHPHHFQLASVDPTDIGGLDLDKEAANRMLARDIERLAKLQERLYAQHQWALLVVLQGMDTAGKDGVIKHVMSGVNPQGCRRARTSSTITSSGVRRSACQPAGTSAF
jgi:polyphosphate kinase 2 (PPK2 family)